MPNRPFLLTTIEELELVIERSPRDSRLLRTVREELDFRSSARARRLQVRVDQFIAALGPPAGATDADRSRPPDPRAPRPPSLPEHSTQARDTRPPADDGGTWRIDEASLAAFIAGSAQPPGPRPWFELRRAAEELALSPGFERLITLNANTIRELPHQIDVARQVLRQMGGRAILADEVGLGKTIEAGIILKELAVRGLARRILILTPAALVDQWQGELESKFFERFEAPKDPRDWHEVMRGITSYHRAVQKRHAEAILRHRWDLVIIDEAHKVKNHETAIHRFIQEIERNFVLLLTATPLQNNLRELYNLVTLLRPGQLGTWREFRQRYMVQGDIRRVKDPEALKELTAQVMVRTRRSSVANALDLPPRHPIHPLVSLTSDEGTLYGATVAFLRSLYAEGFLQPSEDEEREDAVRRRRRTGKGILQLELMRLCQRLCSSARALADSLESLANNGEHVTPEFRARAREIAAAARRVTSHAKLRALSDVLAAHLGQVIVFSEHLPTIELIRDHVRALGRPVIVYQGGLSREQRAKRLADFRREPNAVFIATRAGTEGLNLQFSNVLVNYELPWNPMIIEQRIGRIHRIGQTREAYIVNLAAAGTIEAHILRLLDQKIRLFELVVGELDVILGEFGGAERLEEQLARAWLSATSDTEFQGRLEAIGNAIVESRDAGLLQERLNSEIAAEDSGARLVREFAQLTIPARVRLGYGTNHLKLVRGVDAKRAHLGLHVSEVLETLDGVPHAQDAGISPDYGPLVRLTGVTCRGRAVHLLVQANRLPMTLIDVDADPEAPLIPVVPGIGEPPKAA